MYKFILLLLLPLSAFTQKQSGFLDFTWNDNKGELTFHLNEAMFDVPFLYVNSLAAGVGSNDIGLDRGQLGDNRVVRFYRSGNKVLLIHDNLAYRAVSDNPAEVAAVKEAFANSVIFGFKIISQTGTNYIVDATPFLLNDTHGVTKSLERTKQGNYKLDLSRSAIYKEGLHNFPDNTEMEALLTFSGRPQGEYIRSVTPTPEFVSVRQHHSFIRLPDDNYKPRKFHPESGYFYTSYKDYAAPIGTDMEKRFIFRHRLEKKSAQNGIGEVTEPIIYYIDRGCPEPVKSALMEGGAWWNQAFEYAGYKNAFQVKELPEDAHPLDVRYNMIQWVHRSTRGWSYGASVSDPRTGEIIKGHVSLGSLRVRQDYMIAEGIISAYDENSDDPRMLQMALDRLRQLSAHEIGHTLGLAHNFAASHNDRASVMDYPHPYVILDGEGTAFDKAYDQRIGEWDKRTITYGYGIPADGQTESEFLDQLIQKNKADGLSFITDKDARPRGGLHPYAHLWDNGNDPVGELERISMLRKHVISNLGKNSIKDGTPYSEIEKLLVPAYLMHRYQVDGAAKLIGGHHFEYSQKPNPINFYPVKVETQKKALTAILETLDVDFLKLPSELLALIPPTAYGYPKDRENFKGTTGSLFDPLSAAEASVAHSLSFLLHPERLARIQLDDDGNWNVGSYLDMIATHIRSQSGEEAYKMMLEKCYFIILLKTKDNSRTDKQVSALAQMHLSEFADGASQKDKNWKAHKAYLSGLLNESMEKPETFKLPGLAKMPPGSPIGCH